MTHKLLRITGGISVATVLIVCSFLVAMAGAASSAPAFVQQVSGHSPGVASLKLTPTSNITTGNRLVVLVGVWSSSGATASTVTDAAGNTYTELLHYKASDATEMSVWTAPITAGGGTKPAITVKPSSKADVGAAVSEYSGLSTAAGAAGVDQTAHATGTTGSAATVVSGATAPTANGNDLALGFYVDSGFGDSPTTGSGYTQRSNISKASDIDLLSEDQLLPNSGATPNASAGAGAQTVWLMATVVLEGSSSSGPPTAPSAPTGVTATAGDTTATVSWTAPSDGGSPITRYTVTPYIGSTAQTPTTVTGSPPVTNATVTGLTDGTSYTFTVSATNAVGTGPESTPSTAVTPTSNSGGQWSSLMSWPIVAIHSILLNNGKFLVFDGWQQPEPTEVWDPTSQTFTTQTAPDSIFCSGMAKLPDGRVLVIGGYGGLSTGNLGIVDTSIFDPTTSTWTRVANMHYARWYPDLVELPDGRYVAISGNSTNQNTWSDTPEVYDPTTNQWTILTGVSTSQVHEEEYAFSYLVPNGDVFTIGPSEDQSFFLNVDAKTWTQVGGSSGIHNGSSVMYRPGKILYSGGAANLTSSTKAEATTAVIDLTASTPTWQQTAPMAYARIYHTLTMLADGTVLAVGGEPTAGQTGQSEVSGGVLPSEIWDPNTQAWSTVASTGVTRGYHSTAVLMPDGRVLVAGSGEANPGYPGQDSAQIYSPPYLFKGARPTITSSDASATYGSNFTITTPDASSISAVNLVSMGADTHQMDMDQHFVPLSFTQGSGTLSVQAPSSGTYAPPGQYMVFIVNSSGVPSVAAFIQIGGAPTAPAAPTGVTATPGNGSAAVSWTAPSDGNSSISSYTVTPYIGSTAQTPTIVNGTPPVTNATVTGLTNGTAYTFTVTATNSVGTGPPSSPSNSVTPSATPVPTFVQQASAHTSGASSLALSLPAQIGAGNRIIVETGVWSGGGATMKSVTDSAGNTYTELLHYKAGDGTEMSVWSAPITAGAGTIPTITVTPTATADVGVTVLEYSGLSSVGDATVVDQMAHATGTTSKAATVSSGATPATTAGNELAVGFYADSGFGDTLTAGTGFTQRVNVSNTGDIELLNEDQPVAAGATPNAGVGTGANTYWLVATIVFKSAAANTQQSSQVAHALDLATIRSPAAGSGAGDVAVAASRTGSVTATDSRHRPRRTVHARQNTACSHVAGHAARRACVSLHRAAAVTRQAKWRFVYEALVKELSPGLFCPHRAGQGLKGLVGLAGGWFAWSTHTPFAAQARSPRV